MNIFDVLTLIGGLCLFLFGMNLMGDALERSAGSKLEVMIGKLTTGKLAGLLTGLGVTAVIQSSSATTVMVVGFVNSKLMTLKQAIHVIMGANVGTTVTAWILGMTKNVQQFPNVPWGAVPLPVLFFCCQNIGWTQSHLSSEKRP